jgi:hypothetical protein
MKKKTQRGKSELHTASRQQSLVSRLLWTLRNSMKVSKKVVGYTNLGVNKQVNLG